ncbi:hypothetical protein BKP54_02275 [Ensifer sp. 1H6]|nr:hypothetical protein BKP54_02275 [Ensifer sp. 1H6]
MLQRNRSAFLVLAVTSLVSGCADYMNHRDTITFGLGNAVEANKGIHIQDPFPRAAQNTRIAADGKLIQKVMRGYNGGGTQPAAITPGQSMGSNGATPSY